MTFCSSFLKMKAERHSFPQITFFRPISQSLDLKFKPSVSTNASNNISKAIEFFNSRSQFVYQNNLYWGRQEKRNWGACAIAFNLALILYRRSQNLRLFASSKKWHCPRVKEMFSTKAFRWKVGYRRCHYCWGREILIWKRNCTELIVYCYLNIVQKTRQSWIAPIT